MFDPYRKWLGIPEDSRPPTHYQLLGISPDENDREVIHAARALGDQRVQLWDIASGKLIKEFRTEEFDSNKASLSRDGKYLAAATRFGAIVYDVQKGKVAASMTPAALLPGQRVADVDGLAFSPDGQELAMLTDHGKRIVCFNGRARAGCLSGGGPLFFRAG